MNTSDQRTSKTTTGRYVVRVGIGTVLILFLAMGSVSALRLDTIRAAFAPLAKQGLPLYTDGANDAGAEHVYLPLLGDIQNLNSQSMTGQIYRDAALGFTLELPADWHYEANPFLVNSGVTSPYLEVKVAFANFAPPLIGMTGSLPEGCHFEVLVAKSDDLYDTRNQNILSAESVGEVNASSLQELSINGYPALRRELIGPDSTVLASEIVLDGDGDNLFGFLMWSDTEDLADKCNSDFEEILHSFSIS